MYKFPEKAGESRKDFNMSKSPLELAKELLKTMQENPEVAEQLEKSYQDIKGVHKPASPGAKSGDPKGGSAAGAAARIGLKEHAKYKHGKVLDELRSMPKPNLPKSEHQPHPGPKSAIPEYEAAHQAEKERKLKSPEGEKERQARNTEARKILMDKARAYRQKNLMQKYEPRFRKESPPADKEFAPKDKPKKGD